MQDTLITVDKVSKSFTGAAGDELRVLDEITLELRAGEIVRCWADPAPASPRCCAPSPA